MRFLVSLLLFAVAASAPARAGRWSLRDGKLADFLSNVTHPCHFPANKHRFDPSKWTLTFADEFDGKGDPSCYSRKALCQNEPYGGLVECPPEAQQNLQKLNKCNWTIFNYRNYMFEAVNDFSASDVSVENGMLVLTSRRRASGSGQAITAGGLDGNPHGAQVKGFAQQYGRFEVRAKLPKTPGSWPAHWLMPSEGNLGWPGDGEIDIMESFADKTSRAAMTLHWADNGQHQDNGIGCAINLGKRFDQDFHVFAIEWEAAEIRWYVDDHLVGRQRGGAKNAHGSRIQIPHHPFYWILNTTISPMGGGAAIDPAHFPTGKHFIDYVRVYRRK